MDYAKKIFNNEVTNKDYKKALKGKKNFIKKFSDDSCENYHLQITTNNVLDEIGCKNLTLSNEPLNLDLKKPIIVGNIRMGFGHYRISMAIASCAKAMGYEPIWFDLNSFKETTGGKIINYQNDLYSFGSRLSQKSKLFNKFYWEPLNYEGFRKLRQNASDQKSSELMTSIFKDIDPEIPFVATHVWPSQAAIHYGMKHVCNAIPDNWQMALHLSEGSIHAIQTPNSYFGYKNLRGMASSPLKSMPANTIFEVGHYVDHELVSNIDIDCNNRINRINNNQTLRYLLTIGGAGSQFSLFKNIILNLLPEVNQNKIALFINTGDHINVLNKLISEIPELKEAHLHSNDFDEVKSFSTSALDNNVTGIHLFYDQDIFSAVYSTNLLMRVSDLLITKPSELSFYPIPKLFIQRVGGHEKWGAIHSAEIGDGTYECETLKETIQMLQLFNNQKETLINMNNHIILNNKIGLYNGGYKAIELITKGLKNYQ